MNIDKIEERKEELLLYWCANITEGEWKEGGEGEGEEGVTVFPIVTLEDYDDEVEYFFVQFLDIFSLFLFFLLSFIPLPAFPPPFFFFPLLSPLKGGRIPLSSHRIPLIYPCSVIYI